jgi:N-acetylglutamate synthase-like GNAT family acetyltransferase
MTRNGRHFQLRPAGAHEQLLIWRMVIGAGLNPLHLRWDDFILTEGAEGDILGCGQIKNHRDGSRELASIYVRPEARGQGVAKSIIKKLLAETSAPVWLTCRRELRDFYRRFGFEEVHSPESMPAYFHRVKRLVRLFSRADGGSPLAVMCWRGS